MARQLSKKLQELSRSGLPALCFQIRVPATLRNIKPGCLFAQSIRPYGCRFQQVLHVHWRRQTMHVAPVTNCRAQCVASLHCGDRSTAPGGGASGDVVTFIKDEHDLARFLDHISNLLSTPAFSKIKMPRADTEAKLEGLVRRLIDTRADPRNIFAFLRSNPKVLNSKWDVLLANLQYLDELGLFGNRALLVLDRNPGLWNAGLDQLKERVRRLRQLGLVEGSLQRVITAWPSILTLRKNRLNGSLEMLRKCQFANRHITAIIVSSPQVLDSDPADIELRFQYVYFAMGLHKQEDMVQANLFKYPLDHTRRRHVLLDRLGVYEMPNKWGNTHTDNPKLGRIIDCTDARFAEKCAGVSLEEFQVFGRTFDEEEEEVKGGSGSEEDTDEDFSDFDARRR